MRRNAMQGLLLTVLLGAGCGDEAAVSAPTPPPPPEATAPTPRALSTEVIEADHTGETRIRYLSSNLAPGSTMSGCGNHISGCEDRVSMQFEVLAPENGFIDSTEVRLHATYQIACLIGRVDAFHMLGGTPKVITVELDRSGDCETPLEIAHMSATLTGNADEPRGLGAPIGAWQGWGIEYRFLP